jgi:Holliday junction resolvase RusA-like endonuclease
VTLQRVTSELAEGIRKFFAKRVGAALFAIFLAVQPAPASRPRVPRFGRPYYTGSYAEWRKSASDFVRGIKLTKERTEKPLVVVVEQVIEKPRTGKLLYPKGDADNHAKGPLDILTQDQRWWKDDDQVIVLAVFKRYSEAGEQAGSKIDIYEVNDG